MDLTLTSTPHTCHCKFSHYINTLCHITFLHHTLFWGPTLKFVSHHLPHTFHSAITHASHTDTPPIARVIQLCESSPINTLCYFTFLNHTLFWGPTLKFLSHPLTFNLMYPHRTKYFFFLCWKGSAPFSFSLFVRNSLFSSGSSKLSSHCLFLRNFLGYMLFLCSYAYGWLVQDPSYPRLVSVLWIIHTPSYNLGMSKSK